GCGKAVPYSTTPTPDSSPQGGGEKFAAPPRRKLTPMRVLLPSHADGLDRFKFHAITTPPKPSAFGTLQWRTDSRSQFAVLVGRHWEMTYGKVHGSGGGRGASEVDQCRHRRHHSQAIP